ncbi:MAG: hypothetical protein H6636_05780 [Anaerolineales bacterium]|nr:hypothetical protein [Anaerolineales bacterium]
MKKLTNSVFIILGVALLVVASGLVFRAIQTQNTPPFGARPVPVWVAQPDQSFVQTSDGVFGANAVLVTSQEIILFYELRTQLPLSFEMESAFSITRNGENQVSSFTKIDNIQSLGKFADIEIGAVHIQWSNQPDQVLNLRVVQSGSKDLLWQISPLVQLTDDPGKSGITFLPIASSLSTVKIEMGKLGGEDNYAVLKVSSSTNADSSPVFLQMDSQAVISQITEAEFNTLISPNTSPDTQNPTMATPAPPEEP